MSSDIIIYWGIFTMKKFVAILLVLMMALAMVPAMAAGGFVVNGTTYSTLQAAYAAANDGDTITMTGDVTGGGLTVDKDITIDFGGYTYTLVDPAVGSTGTTTLGFQLLKDNNVTMKNGTVQVADEAEEYFAMLIQNYANLTLTDMYLDGTNLDRGYTVKDYEYSYTVSNNSGTVNINGNTSIIGNDEGEGDIALSADKYASYAEPTVYVDTTGVIDGNLDVTTENSVGLVITKGIFTDTERAIEYYDGTLIRDASGAVMLGFPTAAVPETGDEATIILWSAMILLAGAALIMMKKKSYNY